MSITNASLAQKVNDLLDKWTTREEEMRTWLSGVAGGGDFSDGTYPLTDALGNTRYTKSPAQLEDDVSGLVDSASSYADAADASATAAAASEADAETAQGLAETARTDAEAAEAAAQAAQSAAENAETNALAHRNNARSHRDKAELWAEEAYQTEVETGKYSAKHWATVAEGFAGSVDSGLYYQATEVDALLGGKSDTGHTHSYLPLGGGALTGNLSISGQRLILGGSYGWQFYENTDGIYINIPGSGGAEFYLTGDPNDNTAATLAVGGQTLAKEPWVSSQLAGKSDVGHTHVEADITDLDKYTQAQVDSALAGKADTGHTHSYLPLAGGTVSGQTTFSDQVSINDLRQYVDGEPRGSLTSTGLFMNALFEATMSNQVQFHPASLIDVEYSTDNGATWLDAGWSDAQKAQLVAGAAVNSSGTIPNGCDKFRVTIHKDNYVFLEHLYLYITTRGNTFTSKITARQNGTSTWDTIADGTAGINGWPTHKHIPHSTVRLHPSAYSDAIRLELEISGSWNGNTPTFQSLEWWGPYPARRRTIYDWDTDRNVYFPSAIRFSGNVHGIEAVTGDYGTVQTSDSGQNNWRGYSIGGDFVFMSPTSNELVGIYNDVDGEWMARFYRNSRVELYYDDDVKFETRVDGIQSNGVVVADSYILTGGAARATWNYTGRMSSSDDLNDILDTSIRHLHRNSMPNHPADGSSGYGSMISFDNSDVQSQLILDRRGGGTVYVRSKSGSSLSGLGWNRLVSAQVSEDISASWTFENSLTVNGQLTVAGDNNTSSTYDVRLTSNYDYDGLFQVKDGGNTTRFTVGRDGEAHVGPPASGKAVLHYNQSGYNYGGITVGTTAPSSPQQGDLWFDTN